VAPRNSPAGGIRPAAGRPHVGAAEGWQPPGEECMEPIGIGIVGAGFAANQHAAAYQAVTRVPVNLVGVASRTPERAEAFARRHGFAFATTELAALLARPDVHLVDVCAPNFAHEEILVAAARAGKHVICEKPLTAFFGDPTDPARMRDEARASVQRIHEAVQQAGVHFFYAENWIYAPAIQKAMRLCEAAGGTLVDIRAEEAHSGSHSPYARQWRTSGGGSLLRLGSHPLAAALYLKRREGLRRSGTPIRVASVTCEVANVTRIPSFTQEPTRWVASGWQDVEDWATLLLEFTDGARASIAASDIVLGGIRNRMELYLSNGRIDCNLNPNNTCVAYAPSPEVFGDEYIAEKLDTKAGWSFPSINEDWFQGYPQEIQEFVECVATGREPLSDMSLAADVVEVTYAAYQSAREGRRVLLA
jgi:predicted dehydrogenase